jgi:hypothetical protein
MIAVDAMQSSGWIAEAANAGGNAAVPVFD